MKFFRWLAEKFGDGHHDDPVIESYRSAHQFGGGQLTYRPDLIKQLEREHRLLEQAFDSLVAAHDAGDYDECVSVLRRFTTILRAHLLKENTLLYVYLRKLLEYDAESSALVNSMRMEMQGIGKVLNQFVTDYTSTPWDADIRRRLALDIGRVRLALGSRIENEESALYPLYLPESALAEERLIRVRDAQAAAG
jgi:hypothetical protein